MRARIAKLKDRIAEKQTKSSVGGGGGFAIKKFGDATIVLVGFPSVGKSTLLNALTNAKSSIAEYAFTTVNVIPGMMNYKGAQIQALDVPGLIEGAAQGKGRGREVLSVVRSADLLLVIAPLGKEKQFNQINQELYLNGVRINEERPKVEIKKILRGGIKVNSTVPQELDRETIIEVVREFGFSNAEVTLKEHLTINRLVDCLATNRIYTQALYIASKADVTSTEIHLSGGSDTTRMEKVIQISAETGIGLDRLREALWDKLGLVRVFLAQSGQKKNFEELIIMHKGDKLSDVMLKIGTEFAGNKDTAKIWGPGAKFPGQIVSLSIEAQDKMKVRFF